MNNKKILLPAFILLALLQLYVPAKMIWDSERILNLGTEYKFKTAPVDPTDPFRGKYITLRYEGNTIAVDNEKDWEKGEEIFVYLKTDIDGFATIESASKEKPTDNQDFLKTRIRFVSSNGSNKLTVRYPFDRFYMEESKAYDAEVLYRESQRDTSTIAYALVTIKNGEAVLKDVLIDGSPIREAVIKYQENLK